MVLRNFEGHADLSLDMGKITVLIGPTASDTSAVLRALALLKSVLEGRKPEHPTGSGRAGGRPANGNVDCNANIGVTGRRTVAAGGSDEIGTRFSYRMALDKSSSPVGMDASVDVWCGPPAEGPGTVRLEHSLSQGVGEALVFSARGHDSPTPARVDGMFAPSIQADLADGESARAFDDMFREGWYFGSLLGGLRQDLFSWGSAPASGRTVGERADHDQEAPVPAGHRGGDLPPEKMLGVLKEMGLVGTSTHTVPASGGQSVHIAPWSAMRGMYDTVANGQIESGRPISVLSAIVHSPRGSVVTVEEPEIHLDPTAQVGLAKIMVRQTMQEDKQIVFTTHSDHLLYPLLAYIENKDHPMGPEDVVIHCFGARLSEATSDAERLRINEYGQIRGGLKGFWDVDMKAMDEIVHEDNGLQVHFGAAL